MDVSQLYKASNIAQHRIMLAGMAGDNPEPRDIQTMAKCAALIAIFNPRCELEFDDDLPF